MLGWSETDLQVCLSWELPLSAIPLHHLLPCHLGPPKLMLSINLYVKGPLDCTIGAFHMSILASLFSYRMRSSYSMHTCTSSSLVLVVTMSCGLTLQIFLIIVLSIRCRHWSLAKLSMATSYWHGALLSSLNTCTHGHMSWKRGDRKRELVVAPELLAGGFHTCCDWKFTAISCWEHVSKVARGSYHLQLDRLDLDFPLWSAVQGACSSLALWTSVIRFLCQAIESSAFLVHPVLAAVSEYADATHSSATEHILTWLNSAEGPGLWKRCWSLSLLHLLSLFSSIASFQVKSLLTHSSNDSAMIPSSWAEMSSQWNPSRTRVTRLQAQWWRAAAWVPSLDEHWPSL